MPDTDKYGTLREHMQVFDIFSNKKFEHFPLSQQVHLAWSGGTTKVSFDRSDSSL